jgi:hypothetical protein
VKITYLSDFRYELGAFEEILPAAPTGTTTVSSSKTKIEYLDENTKAIMACGFIKWCAENPVEVKE